MDGEIRVMVRATGQGLGFPPQIFLIAEMVTYIFLNKNNNKQQQTQCNPTCGVGGIIIREIGRKASSPFEF